MTESEVDILYNQWKKTQDFSIDFSIEELKSDVLENLEYLKSLPIRDYIKQEKVLDLHDKFKVKKESGLFGVKYVPTKSISDVLQVKSNIWIPDDPLNFKVKPKLVLCNGNNEYTKINSILRNFVSTSKSVNNIGRNLYYVVEDELTNCYLGTIAISSDYLDISVRDNKIGWNREQRNSGMINHTAVGSTIIPTQPFGYNFLGGKLLSLLCLSDNIQDDWKTIYGDTLVGVTTTGLYGSFSQYSGLKYWKKCGSSTGSTLIRPNFKLREKIQQLLKVKNPRAYFEFHLRTENGRYKRDHINRSITMGLKLLGINHRDYATGFKRGVYFAELYTNTNDFLCEQIDESKLIKKMDTSISALTEIWRQKAEKRIGKLEESGKIDMSILFFDDVLFRGNEYE
jgi:hypothetical protein